jgi:nucleotide-binding universal stress UspA family protein
MRVLIATDGSTYASEAVDLVLSCHWPAGSILRVVSCVPDAASLVSRDYGMLMIRYADEIEQQMLVGAQEILADAAADIRVRRPEILVEQAILRGRPGEVVADEAGRRQADLIVVGHRGLGQIASMLVGSVSAEVVDRATVPVLVARRIAIRSAVIAMDGSAGATAAVASPVLVPLLDGVPAHVVGVAEPMFPWWSGMTAVGAEAVMGASAEADAAQRANLERCTRETADQLRAAGVDASAIVRRGNPASELIEAAREWDTDLIVLGTRGMTGVTRLVLGSVARNVLLHAPCSVLVVHAPKPVPPRRSSASSTTKRPVATASV